MIALKRVESDIGYDSSTGKFLTTDDSTLSVIQKIATRLKRFYGEWFTDTTKGIDYFSYVFTKAYDPIVIAAIFKAEIYKEETVEQITEFTFDINEQSRVSSITFAARLEDGANTGTVEVVN